MSRDALGNEPHGSWRPQRDSLPQGWYGAWGKRAFDLFVSIPLLVILLPLLLVLVALVRVFLGRPVFFCQERPGAGGRIFTLYKLRTMADTRGPGGELLPDGARLMLFGRFLRSTSLDELPELLNVIRGEMSLVGPRPLLVRYTPYFTATERTRFLVKPGITGLAQISGRNDLQWTERLALDVRYVQMRSLPLDLRILALTIPRIATRRGLRVDPGATLPDLDMSRGRRHSQ